MNAISWIKINYKTKYLCSGECGWGGGIMLGALLIQHRLGQEMCISFHPAPQICLCCWDRQGWAPVFTHHVTAP